MTFDTCGVHHDTTQKKFGYNLTMRGQAKASGADSLISKRPLHQTTTNPVSALGRTCRTEENPTLSSSWRGDHIRCNALVAVTQVGHRIVALGLRRRVEVIRRAWAIGAVKRDGSADIGGVDVGGNAFIGVPKAVHGVVTLAGRCGVEMVDRAPAVHAVKRDCRGGRGVRAKDIARFAFVRVSQLFDRIHHLRAIGGVEMVGARPRIDTVQRNRIVEIVA